jgi:hypothetical protein
MPFLDFCIPLLFLHRMRSVVKIILLNKPLSVYDFFCPYNCSMAVTNCPATYPQLIFYVDCPVYIYGCKLLPSPKPAKQNGEGFSSFLHFFHSYFYIFFFLFIPVFPFSIPFFLLMGCKNKYTGREGTAFFKGIFRLFQGVFFTPFRGCPRLAYPYPFAFVNAFSNAPSHPYLQVQIIASRKTGQTKGGWKFPFF